MKNLKINPLWIAFLGAWIPGWLITLPINENVKTALLGAVMIFLGYCLYVGIMRLNEEKEKQQSETEAKEDEGGNKS